MNPWNQIHSAISARKPFVITTVVRHEGSVPRRSGAKMVVHPDGSTVGSVGGGIFEMLVVRDALSALASGQSYTKTFSFNPKQTDPDAFGAICGGKVDVFFEVIMPQDHLLIVGGGHCGRALCKMAALLDFTITVADDREEFSRKEDFPDAQRVLRVSADFHELPAIDDRTYIALVSKGFITDEAALRRVIDSPAAYIGMIGSIKKRDTVYENMRNSGITDEQLRRVHSPIGLEIKADTPEEIAISILAEIIQIRAACRSRSEQCGSHHT